MAKITEMSRSKIHSLIIALFFLIILFTAWHETYIVFSREWLAARFFPFWVLTLAGFVLALLFSWTITTRRLLSYLFLVFVLEYIKETIGIVSGQFRYNGVNGAYNTGVWLWVMGAFLTYALADRVLIRLFVRLRLKSRRWLNLVLWTAVSALMPALLGSYWDDTGPAFWVFYGVLFVFGLYTARKMNLPTLLALILASWVMGNATEFAGSYFAKIWTYRHNPVYPPLFLLLGCWPLEILAQYSLSSIVCRESLNLKPTED